MLKSSMSSHRLVFILAIICHHESITTYNVVKPSWNASQFFLFSQYISFRLQSHSALQPSCNSRGIQRALSFIDGSIVEWRTNFLFFFPKEFLFHLSFDSTRDFYLRQASSLLGRSRLQDVIRTFDHSLTTVMVYCIHLVTMMTFPNCIFFPSFLSW